MLLRALVTELDRNLDLAKSTRNLLSEKRDMLQGDVKQRLILHGFHTDVWDSFVQQGAVDQLDTPETVASCYEQLKEINELIAKFNEEGDAILHSPLINRDGKDYGRDHVVDIMKELCEEAESVLRDAYSVADQQLGRVCPICGTSFASEDACNEHMRTDHGEQGAV